MDTKNAEFIGHKDFRQDAQDKEETDKPKRTTVPQKKSIPNQLQLGKR